ncbi:MAG: hypothetical protein NVSMB23_05320 [Myxococcales bacterium]
MPRPRPRKQEPPARTLLRRIRLLVLDVDGTLTDGRLYYGKDGEALKAFDVRDGHGLRLLQIGTGVKLAVLTGRSAGIIRPRCAEMGIDHVVDRSREKGPALRRIAADLGVPLEATCFMGDDVNDLPALAICALPACPSDAVPEVLRACSFVSPHPGGRGAVRDLCELLLAATVGWPPPEPPPSPPSA